MAEQTQGEVEVLGLWGRYQPATVLEAHSGIFRLSFGEGQLLRWALPEQILAEHPPSAAALVPGAYVAARVDDRADGGAINGGSPRRKRISSLEREVLNPILLSAVARPPPMTAVPGAAAADDVFHRAVVVATRGGSVTVECDNGTRHDVPVAHCRVPHAETPRDDDAPQAGARVHALLGEWYKGAVPRAALAQPPRHGRYVLQLQHTAGRWAAFASRRELVAASCGADPAGALVGLRKGAPLCVRAAALPPAEAARAAEARHGEWLEALLVRRLASAPAPAAEVPEEVLVLLAEGARVSVRAEDVRPRDGDGHPVSAARRALGAEEHDVCAAYGATPRSRAEAAAKAASDAAKAAAGTGDGSPCLLYTSPSPRDS